MQSRRHGKVLFKILGVIAGLTLIFFGFQERSDLSRIQKQGKRTIVEPIAQYKEVKRKGSTRYSAEFHFTTEDGQQIVTHHSFPAEVLADFEAGRPVEIVYLPGDPRTFAFAREKNSWTLVFTGIILAALAFIFA